MAATSVVAAVVGPATFALADPLPLARPWTAVTSVYAHAGLGHFLSNTVVVALAGLPVALATTRGRFHGFFVGAGVVAGVAQVLAGADAVVGASGAAFALVGYALAANPVTGLVGARVEIPLRAIVATAAVVAVGLALAFGGPGGAFVAHAVGAALGLLAGRTRLLAVGDGRRTER